MPAAGPATPSAQVARARSKRLGGSAQDNALYACECGLVFEAAVSTAVSCPHCGQTQAW